jgi:hypothetical protein
MVLRKCASCGDLVGGESATCPRCGVRFRAAAIRRAVRWALVATALTWVAVHYLLKVV